MNPPSLVEKLIAGILRNPLPALLLVLTATGFAGWGMAEIDIRTSRKALMPQDVEVSKRLNRFLDRFGAASDMILVVEQGPRSELEEFASQLARRLEKKPQVRQAVERVDLVFFLKNAHLLVPPKMVKKFSDLVTEMLSEPPPEQLRHWHDAWKSTDEWLTDPPDLAGVDMDIKTAEEGLHMGLFVLEQWLRWLEGEVAPKSIAFNTLLARHGAESMASGYFASRDSGMLFVFVRPANSNEEFEAIAPFVETVRGEAEALRVEWQTTGRNAPKVGLTGLPAAAYEEYLALRKDILITVVTATILIILLILVWLRSVRWALVVFIPMAVGVVWNIGLAHLIIGHLNMITSGFTAILFGLGVDYGIFMSTRIIEERRKTDDLSLAIARGSAASGRALLTAGGATVLIFIALAFVDFDGFSELGQVAACGVGMVLLSTFIIQPILFKYLTPKVKIKPEAQADRAEGKRPVKQKRLIPVCLVLLALAGATYGGYSVFSIPFSYDVMALLPEDSETAYYQQRMLKESDYQGEVLIFTAPNIDAARVLRAKAQKLKSLARVQGITDLFPPDAEDRVAQARQMGQLIDSSAYAGQLRKLDRIQLSEVHDQRIQDSLEKIQEILEDAQEQAFSAGHGNLVKVMESMLEQIEKIQDHYEKDPQRTLLRTQMYVQTLLDAGKYALDVIAGWKDARVLQPKDLPGPLHDRFFGSDGTVAFYAFPKGDVYERQTLNQLMDDAYSLSPEVTGFPTTHHVFSKMVVESFERGTLMAILVAVLWIGLIFRKLRSVLLASLPLLVGGGWMMGAIYLSGMSFNFANIIALPLVMGLAVDYGVWFAHRQREFSNLSGWQVTRRAGTAIMLAAGTTLAGLGAITQASYKGVASMGVAITIGLVCCVVAALLIAPALTELIKGKNHEE